MLQNTSGAFGGFYEANDPGVIPMHLKGNASQTANYFTIGRGSSAGDVLAVSGAGNLGVGSSTPWAKLSVKGAGTTTGVNFQTTDSADTPLFTVLDNGGTTMLYATSTTFFATTASSTNLFAQTAALGALSAGSLTVSGNTTHTGTLTQTGLATFTNGFVSQASSTVVGNFTTSGNGIFSGTFGIGTTSPAATLGVNGTAYLSGTASLTAPSLIIGGQNRLELGNSSGSNMAWIAASGINTNLILRSQTNVGVSSSTLSIYPGAKFSVSGGVAVGSDFYTTAVTDGNMIVSGNVGVGSSSPFAKLSIKGAGSTTGINFQTTDTNNLSLFSILDNGGTTMLYATSTTFFATTASSTNLFAATGAIGALSAGSLTVSGNTIHTGTLTQTGLASFVQASTTRLSVHGTAYFGGTATTTIDSAGNLAVAGTLGVSGNTTLANATSSAFFATTASSTNLFAQAASFGSLALPSFAQNRVPYFGAAGAVTSGSGFTYDGTTLTAGNLTSAGAVSLGFATSTTSFATTASSTNLFAAIASVGQLSIPNLGTAAGTFLAADPTGKLIATSSPGLSGTTGQIAYLSGTNTAVGTSTLFITTGSNVGIGTTSPQAKLDIVRTSAGATADVLAISNLSSATSTASRLLFRTGDLTNNTGTTTAAITSLLTQNYTAAKGDLIFSTLASGALTEAMRLTSTGLLGIGTSTPTHRLSVANAASAPQFSLSYNSGAWTTQQVDASGNWTQTSSGGYNIFSNDNVEICANGSCPTTTATSTAGNLFVENAVVIGDGFSLREIDGLSLGLYNVAGGLMVTFDNNN